MSEYYKTTRKQARESDLLQADMFGQTLPRRPYACDDVRRPRITTIRRAIERRYIQLNEPWRRVWIVTDVDRPGAAVAWEDADIAPPNWTAINRANGHCHNGWLLDIPVLMGDHDRKAPMHYLDAVEGCMSERIGAESACCISMCC